MPINRSDILTRALDISLSGIVLVGLSPILLSMALAIKLTSKGPIVYRQERLGKGKESFVMYKFRTMIENAEPNGPQLAIENDPRITKIGKFLRRHHLDELLQFWNVMKGDMTLIGPRPERDIYITEIEKKFPEYHRIFKVKPGITSPGIVECGYASDINHMIERSRYDLAYLDNKDLFRNIDILMKTFKTIIKGS